jgi:AraC-like DNA-binding protein
MPGSPSDFRIVHFSAEALPERERIEMWRDFYGPLVAKLDVEPLSEGPLTFEADARVMPDLTLARLTSSPVRLERKIKHLVGGDDRVCLAVALSGGGWLRHLGRELTRPAASAYLCSHSDPLDAVSGQGISSFINISLPRRVLAASVPQFEIHFMRPISPDSEALRLLTAYLKVLEQENFEDRDLCRVVVGHVHELVALALGATRDAAEIATSRGLRAARLHAIKADIRTSLGDHGLSVTAVAARHGVTPRYVQALFADEELTFSQYLMRERLGLVHQMLQSPQHAAMSTSAIAYAAGFGDISHFNRAFRRRYGAAPSDVRTAAQR